MHLTGTRHLSGYVKLQILGGKPGYGVLGTLAQFGNFIG
jgi:hypothetical protein